MRSKFRGSLLAAALGDALGRVRGRSTDPLEYTDDTAETLVLALHLAENCHVVAERLAIDLAEGWRREPWRGYGPGPPKIFRMILRGEGPLELDKKLYPGGSYGNGCAMRISPLGLFYNDVSDELPRHVREACRPTHNHPLGFEGALVQAAAVSYAVSRRPGELDPKDMLGYLVSLDVSDVYRGKLKEAERLLEYGANLMEAEEKLGVGVEAFSSVPTAVYAFVSNMDLEKTVLEAARLHGDSDTIASMAGAIAGANMGEESVPMDWIRALMASDRILEAADGLYRALYVCKRDFQGWKINRSINA